VRDFLELPLKQINETPGTREANDLLVALKPGNVFFAAVRSPEENPRVLVGIQFWGKRADFDKAVTRLREELPSSGSPPVRTEYRGLEILASEHEDQALFSAAAGRWGFLSNDEDILRSAIDRATGNSTGDGLSRNEEFRRVSSELLKEPDLLAYVRMDAAVESLLAAGNSLGAVPISDQVDKLKSARALGAAWKIDGNLQRDSIFLLRSEVSHPAQPLEHLGLELTKPDTLLYLDFQLDLGKLPDFIDSVAEIYPDAAGVVQPLARQIADDFGPEFALIAEWPKGASLPSPLLALQLRNPTNDFLANMASVFPMSSTQTIGNRQVYNFPAVQNLAASQNDRFLAVGIDPAMVASALEGHSETLRDSPVFQKTKSTLKSADEAFCFIETRTIFERSYTALMPVIRFGAAIVPEISKTIDVSKLPKPETIGQHLPPIVLSQSRKNEGILLESSGPVSMSQFLILTGAASVIMQRNPFDP
jgi:hypothetical protein